MLSSPWISGVKGTPFFFAKDLGYVIAVFKNSFKKGLPCCAGVQILSLRAAAKRIKAESCHTLLVEGALMMRTGI